MEQYSENEKGFYTNVIEASRDKLILVNFYRANGCAPCNHLKPILEQNGKERFDYNTVYINVEDSENGKILRKYNIQRVPTNILFSVGKPLSQYVGFLTKVQLNTWLDNFKEAEWKELEAKETNIPSVS